MEPPRRLDGLRNFCAAFSQAIWRVACARSSTTCILHAYEAKLSVSRTVFREITSAREALESTLNPRIKSLGNEKEVPSANFADAREGRKLRLKGRAAPQQFADAVLAVKAAFCLRLLWNQTGECPTCGIKSSCAIGSYQGRSVARWCAGGVDQVWLLSLLASRSGRKTSSKSFNTDRDLYHFCWLGVDRCPSQNLWYLV